MVFLAMMFLIFACVRFGCFDRVGRGHCGAQFGWGPSRRLHHLRHAPSAPQPPPAPKVSAFEALKERYVRGAISDAQYESELDRLLRTPEGRSQIL